MKIILNIVCLLGIVALSVLQASEVTEKQFNDLLRQIRGGHTERIAYAQEIITTVQKIDGNKANRWERLLDRATRRIPKKQNEIAALQQEISRLTLHNQELQYIIQKKELEAGQPSAVSFEHIYQDVYKKLDILKKDILREYDAAQFVQETFDVLWKTVENSKSANQHLKIRVGNARIALEEIDKIFKQLIEITVDIAKASEEAQSMSDQESMERSKVLYQ